MSNDTPWSVRGVDSETREAAKLAARKANIPLGQWLTRAIRNTVAEELGARSRHPDEPPALPALPTEALLSAIQERLDRQRSAIEDAISAASWRAEVDTPVVELEERREPAVGLSPELRDELDQVKLLIHDYLGLLLPAAEPIEQLTRQLQDLMALSQDIRRSADAAERAAAAVAPLERTLLRLTSEMTADARPEDRQDRRGSGLGKLFRG